MKPTSLAKFLVLALFATLAVTACKHSPTKVTRIPGDDDSVTRLASNEKSTIDKNNSGKNNPGTGSGIPTNPTGGGPTGGGDNVTGRNQDIPPNLGGRGIGGGPIVGSTTNGDNGTKPKSFEDLPVAPPLSGDEHPEILADQSVFFDYDSAAVKSSEKHKTGPVADYLKKNPAHSIRIYGNCDERGTEEYNRSLGDRRAMALRTELLGLGIESARIDTVTNGKDKPRALGHDDASWRENRRGDFVVLTPLAAP